MKALSEALLYIHLFGFAAVTAGLLSQWKLRNKEVTSLALNGARLQLVTGLLLYFIEAEDLVHWAAGLKILGATIILVALEMRRKKGLSDQLFNILLLVVLLQVFVAVFLLEAAR